MPYPTAPDFCDWILNRVHITLRPLGDVYTAGIAFEVIIPLFLLTSFPSPSLLSSLISHFLQVHKNIPYDNLAVQVSRFVDVPAEKLVFFIFK